MGEWKAMDPEERTALWEDHNKLMEFLPPGKLINRDVAAFLEGNQDVQTVQDLINTVGINEFTNIVKDWGLSPSEVEKFRTAKLVDWAVIRLPPDGTVPRNVDAANGFHMTQYQSPYNTYTELTGTNNCGPTSLAMALNVLGQMPPGLNTEQQIDYARGLIYKDNASTMTTVTGQTVPFINNDTGEDALVGFDQIVNGPLNAGVPAVNTHDWGVINDAITQGYPLVVAGTMSQSWKTEFPTANEGYGAGSGGHFIAVLGKTDDGRYLVNDPMYKDGAVPMTQEQLQVFIGFNGNAPKPPDVTVIGSTMENP